jgi:hypothetical protein
MQPTGGTTPGPAPAVSVAIEVQIQGATEGARVEFAKAVQTYAELLAAESQTQEISNRPPGVMFPEVTANSVVRAKTAFNRYGQRARRTSGDYAAILGAPALSGATGVLGGHLNSPLQWTAFSASTFLAVVCLIYLAVRRML